MTKLILVRHGQSEANGSGRFAWQSDIPLSDLGKKQAELLKEYLLEQYRIDAIYSSDLSRAYDTVLPFSNAVGLPIRTDRALREMDGGLWDGATFEEISRRYPEDSMAWRTDPAHARCTGGETLSELRQRGSLAIGRIASQNEGRTVLIATHAMFLRAMQCLWEGRPLRDIKEVAFLPNASVSEAEARDGAVVPIRMGECGFLHGAVTGFSRDFLKE